MIVAVGAMVIFSLFVAILVYVCLPEERKYKGKRERSNTADFVETLERTRDILPAVKNFLREILIHRFLNNWYLSEIDLNIKAHCQVQAWSSVAHSSVPKPSKSLEGQEDEDAIPEYATMNIAFPDLSAEYYTTFIPATHSPVFLMTNIPSWAVYSALTLYNAYGLNIASVNLRQMQTFVAAVEAGREVGEGIEACGGILSALWEPSEDSGGSRRVTGVVVNLMRTSTYQGNLCAVFRVYRPSDVDLTPREGLPRIYLLPRGASIDPSALPRALPRLTQLGLATLRDAFGAGVRNEAFFSRLIQGKLREPTSNLIGCQFFHPVAVVGLFPNADAVYVVAWKPQNKRGIRVYAAVPTEEPFRPYYGLMGIDHRTTRTIASYTYDELGGWGASYVAYLCRTEEEAIQYGGYDPANPTHKLILWGREVAGPLGAVLRYLHYFHATGGDGREEVEAQRAREERNALISLTGDPRQPVPNIPGLGRVEYF